MSTPDDHPEEIGAVLDLLGLEEIADEQPSELSQGERKLVGIARALSSEPRVVCLDEPAAGLDTHESEELGRRLRKLADDGQAMVLVDHDMGLVLGICDEVVVLEFGRVIARGAPDSVRRDPQVIAAYLGSAASELAPAALSEAAASVQGAIGEATVAEPVLALEGLTAGYDEAAVIRDVGLRPGRGRSWLSWAPTAPARPRRFGSSPGS